MPTDQTPEFDPEGGTLPVEPMWRRPKEGVGSRVLIRFRASSGSLAPLASTTEAQIISEPVLHYLNISEPAHPLIIREPVHYLTPDWFESTQETLTAPAVADYSTVMDAARAYGEAFSKSFGREIRPVVENVQSPDGSNYWRMTVRLPRRLLGDVPKLFAKEKSGYKELARSHPELVGLFALHYTPLA